MLDEPSAGLAPTISKMIFTTLAKLNAEFGVTIFMVEQNARQALQISHRGYVLELGQTRFEGTGAALLAFNGSSARSEPIADVFWGPCFNEAQIAEALGRAQLPFDHYLPIEPKIAQLIAEGKVVARFDGRMEYGPRALGNRSILYHAREPEVNQWLNQRLGRTEFMPFAPATLYEHRDDCYKNIDGADYAAQFMTVTFDCTERMKRECPAAVHVDGTARPQLVTSTSNPSFYRIISEYHRLTGIPSVINTSFNMHEEPIVCTPDDAIRAFLQGNLEYLAIGNFLVAHPRQRR